MNKQTLVLGASTNPARYSYKAIVQLSNANIPVVAVGNKKGQVLDSVILSEIPKDANIDTVTVYLNAANQALYENQILELNPRRIIFNPGAENPEFAQTANKKGIKTENACTLVMLSLGAY